MNKKILIAVIVAGIALPAGVYAISPLFINTTIDEPLPTIEMMTDDSMTGENSDSMMKKDDAMTDKEKMEKAVISKGEPIMMFLSGDFVGVGDGIHDAQGQARVISLEDGSDVLRLENFESTNGPDLYVYLSTDDKATDYVNLGRLKANNGNQNYNIPDGTDLSRYDSVLIWCKQFSVLFGTAKLS
ncbi:MAG: DM13 domain-containing protein [Nitrosopumilaceae archaeon]